MWEERGIAFSGLDIAAATEKKVSFWSDSSLSTLLPFHSLVLLRGYSNINCNGISSIAQGMYAAGGIAAESPASKNDPATSAIFNPEILELNMRAGFLPAA